MSTSPTCPKCGFTANMSFKECPRCGVIVSKFLHKAKGDRQADNFGITFPNGIDLSQKAVLLGAVFLIDFIHFENSGKRN